ncbi:DNA topoisomerase IV subunit B [Emcibacter sp. SYSU 3D8]|uniref:DNA topoisomerase IV subunit B n=1 Tax=Emcibacter sp. SYSU 3D8 TaxID=3133969 RepID=UPI0031FF30B9
MSTKPNDDLFAAGGATSDYSAKDIEVLEGLEPVRRRPGMYVGGTDEKAFHHLAAEVLDNSMDEAVAGHASRIEIELREDGSLSIRDNGRGIPVDAHPKFKTISALEVIMTTLHSGGKFGGKVYETSGGLHGVGVSVVNALSEWLDVEVARDRKLWRQTYSRGKPTSRLDDMGPVQNRRGTTISFRPDPQIFGDELAFKPARLYRMARSKAYLYRGVEIRWSCAPSLLKSSDTTPETEVLHFPNGLLDFLNQEIEGADLVTPAPFAGSGEMESGGRVEWAIAWPIDRDGFINSYCNTVPTPEGGTHETGMRNALVKGLKAYAELAGNRKAGQITAEDVLANITVILSVFIREPQFQGQTKERLASPEATRVVETAMRDHFDHWLSGAPQVADSLLAYALLRAEERIRRKQEKETGRKSATRKLRLPGKLTDCANAGTAGTELFIVEGDSAGGSAKMARDRANQAVLPLRGKILNVASAAQDKASANQELKDLVQALGCGTGTHYREEDLRYEKIVIMTDADVDGAHIATLLMTFFFHSMQGLIREGHLYLAMPPLYRMTHKNTTVYAQNDAEKDQLIADVFNGSDKVEVGRFKGLGEMSAAQLKATTMNPATRTLLRVKLPEGENRFIGLEETSDLVDRLMGKRPEMRFEYIQKHASTVSDLDV